MVNEIEYYYWELNVRVASRVAERLKTYDIRKWQNVKKIVELSVE